MNPEGIKDFHTESGSVYRVDFNKRLVRRIAGKGEPTPRIRDRTEFAEAFCRGVGQSLVIVWRMLDDHGFLRVEATETSPVVKIEDVVAS